MCHPEPVSYYLVVLVILKQIYTRESLYALFESTVYWKQPLPSQGTGVRL